MVYCHRIRLIYGDFELVLYFETDLVTSFDHCLMVPFVFFHGVSFCDKNIIEI